MPKPDFPFADALPIFSPSVPTPWLGGMVVPVPSHGMASNFAVAHGLRRVPRFSWLLDVGRNTSSAVVDPIPRGVSTWDYTNAYFNWPQTTDTCLVFFG